MLEKELSDSMDKQVAQERKVAAERKIRHDQQRSTQHALPVSQNMKLEENTDFFAYEEESSEEYCSEDDEATAMFVRPAALPSKGVDSKDKVIRPAEKSISTPLEMPIKAQSKDTMQCTILLPSRKEPVTLFLEKDQTVADVIASVLVPRLLPFPISALGKLTGWYLLYDGNKPLSGHTKVLEFYKKTTQVRFVPETMIQVHLTVSGSHPLRLSTICSTTVPVSSLINSWCEAFGLSKQSWGLWTAVRQLSPSEILAGTEDSISELILRP